MNEQEILSMIRAGQVRLPPLEVRLGPKPAPRAGDARLEVVWSGKRYPFVAALKARSTPKILRAALLEARRAASLSKTNPLVIVPYLTEEQIRELEKEGVSGLDLNGNGVVIVPGRLFVSRAGRPNRFPEKSVLKNVYRGKVSTAARVFLLRPEYSAVQEIRQEILTREGTVALSTVSKVLQRLEDDLVVARESGRIRLIQPDKLLELLAREYRPPEVNREFVGKTSLTNDRLSKTLAAAAEPAGARLALTGATSVSQYAVMARDEPVTFYCSDLRRLLTGLDPEKPILEETDRFPNVRVVETDEDIVYFDVRRKRGVPWASPVQTYLELMSGDKRDRETAAQLARDLLPREGGRRAR
ncbi:MAG: hypothetical protein ACRD1X_20970 [Vicinamibacteria bacterium]